MLVTLSTLQQRNPVMFHFMAYVQRYISTVSYELIKLNTGGGFAMRRSFNQVSACFPRKVISDPVVLVHDNY